MQYASLTPGFLMNEPQVYCQYERVLDPFVVAAKTSVLNSACDLLFIHGNDLTWDHPDLGFFLIGVEIDQNFEEVTQVANARAEIGLSQFMRELYPDFRRVLFETVTDIAPNRGDQTDVFGAVVSSLHRNKNFANLLEKGLPTVLAKWPLFADGIASQFSRDAIFLLQRQLNSTGMTKERYDAMLYALQRINLCEHIARIAYPEGCFHSEVSLTSGGEFKATEVREGTQLIEVLRLRSHFASLKSGQDNALAVFIADYVNRHHIGPRRAFSCVRYGGQNEPELDVVIPALNIGFEVKVYQAPFAQTPNKLEKLANDLKRQLPAYSNRGCKRIYYVSNLSESMAKSVLKRVQSDETAVMNIEPIAGGVTEGMDALLPVLNEIGKELEELQKRNLERRMQELITTPKKKKKRRSPTGKKTSEPRGAHESHR